MRQQHILDQSFFPNCQGIAKKAIDHIYNIYLVVWKKVLCGKEMYLTFQIFVEKYEMSEFNFYSECRWFSKIIF